MQHQLTSRQQSILAAIQLNPAATLQEIGDQLGITRERVRQVATGLEALGLIEPRKQLRAEAIGRERAAVASALVRTRFLIGRFKRLRKLQRLRHEAGLPKSGVLVRYAMPGPGTVCQYEGCTQTVRARGYCNGHYSKLRKSGVLWVQRITAARCYDCSKPTYARGYCQYHYERHRKKGDLQATQAPKNLHLPKSPDSQAVLQPKRNYPCIDKEGSYWVLKARQPDGTIKERKFTEKKFADQALWALQRKR